MANKPMNLDARKGVKNVRSYECFYNVLNPLKKHLPLRMQGEWKIKDVYGTLIGTAAERQSIHSIDKVLVNNPSETSMWHHLKKLNIDRIIEINNRLLSEPIMDCIDKKKPHIFIIDETDDPYYGEITDLNEEYVVSGKTKKSTNQFYRYITLYIVIGQKKFTLAVLPVKKDKTNVEYVQEFIEIIGKMELKIKVLLMDRGFYSTELFLSLQKSETPFIVPVKRHGKEMKRLLNCRCSHYTTYTMDGKAGSVDLSIAIAAKYIPGKYGKGCVKTLGYIVSGINWKPRKVAKAYEKRFSIEASYRMRNIVRPRTSTKCPSVRYLMALISMLLKNVWVAMKWRYFSPVKRGPRTIDEGKYRFDQFRLMVWRFVMKKFRFVEKVPALRSNG